MAISQEIHYTIDVMLAWKSMLKSEFESAASFSVSGTQITLITTTDLNILNLIELKNIVFLKNWLIKVIYYLLIDY